MSIGGKRSRIDSLISLFDAKIGPHGLFLTRGEGGLDVCITCMEYLPCITLCDFLQERTTCFLYWLIAKSILLLCQVPLYILMSSFDKLCNGLAFLLIFMGKVCNLTLKEYILIMYGLGLVA